MNNPRAFQSWTQWGRVRNPVAQIRLLTGALGGGSPEYLDLLLRWFDLARLSGPRESELICALVDCMAEHESRFYFRTVEPFEDIFGMNITGVVVDKKASEYDAETLGIKASYPFALAAIREIVGNPFLRYGRSGDFPSQRDNLPYMANVIPEDVFTWHSGAIPNLAAAIERRRRYDELPILADMLEEAGAGHDWGVELLAHFRHMLPCPCQYALRCRNGCAKGWVSNDWGHRRGCWALQPFLPKPIARPAAPPETDAN